MDGICSVCIVFRKTVILFFFLLVVSIGARANSLYTKDDPLVELSAFNFNRIVLRKDNAWIIQFYNSWCGHCIRFAPVWKAFARDIQGWRKVINVGVVNCADSNNVPVCRNYSVESYPTIRLFKLHTTEEDKGEDIVEGRTSAALQEHIIDLVEQYYRTGVPKNWPDLRPVQEYTIAHLWKNVAPENRKIFLIVESFVSYIGRKVILDTESSSRYSVRRVFSSNDNLMSELKDEVDLSSLPVLLLITEKFIRHLSSSTDDEEVTRKRFREAVNSYSLGHRTTPSAIHPPTKLQITSTPKSGHLAEKVYMVDLENAVLYSLKQEMGVHHVLEGEKLSALKDYVQTLSRYFPGRPPVKKYLAQLNEYVQSKQNSLKVADMLTKMNALQTKEAFLPDMREWVGCKGSVPRYRGYPCSLWTLFHTLTVQALKKYKEGGYNPHTVLFAISGYVKYFFTCKECSRNFQQKVATMRQELHYPNDTVLWLWRAHNQVNKRLAGDLTEDPAHRKVQFPPPNLCSKCHSERNRGSEDAQWNTSEVLKYLMQHYTNIDGSSDVHSRIDRRSVPIEEEILNVKQLEPSDIKHFSEFHEFGDTKKQFVMSVNNLSYSESWTFRYFTGTDMSLCISLYILSGLLLVILYFIFITKRRRRKIQYIRMPFMYP